MTKKMRKMQKIVKLPTREESIEAAKQDLLQYNNGDCIASPERKFESGQSVLFGGWQKTTIIESFVNGKAYVLDCSRVETRHGQKIHKTAIISTWWYEIQTSRKVGDPVLFEPHRRGQLLNGPLETILFMYGRDGIVCDPTYQRGYVWTEFDREQLLTSIFERLEIGSFLFVHKRGFNHKPEEGAIIYNTLHGETITVPKYKDFSYTIIDGQQRLTTLINFCMDKFSYKGQFFSDLTQQDQNYFWDFGIHYRKIDEHEVTRKELLRLFLQANRGVPQSPEHLKKVQKLYEQEQG